MQIDLDKIRNDENGIALIIAIILILVMTTLASTISFLSNNDFYSMSNYKRGQEAFLASESCVIEIRKILENIEPNKLYEVTRADIMVPEVLESELGSNIFVQKPVNINDNPDSLPDSWHGPVCRTGSRALGPEQIKQPSNYLITNEHKSSRPAKNYSESEFGITPISIIVTGKDSLDGDKTDDIDKINTGIEIIVGFEVLTPGGNQNQYSR